MKKLENNKILLASEYFLPHWTGIVATFAQIAESLSKNHSITVLTTQYDTSLPLYEKINSLEIVRTGYTFKLSRTYYSLQTLWWLFTHIHLYTTVIINSPHSNILFITSIAKLFRKTVMIYHQGDLKFPRKTGNIIINFIVERIFDILTLPAMFMADKVGTYTKDYAQRSRVMKYFLYKFFAYIPEFKKPTELQSPSEKIKKTLNHLKKDHRLIGFAGRFVEEKGFDILFQAIPAVIKKDPNCQFIFAGSRMDYEPFFDSIKPLYEKSKKNITFLGLLNKKDLSFFYSQLDLFVLSSRSDCFPVTQIESVNAGVPLVTTDIPGARMIVKESGFGAIAEPENSRDLAEKINDILNTPRKTLEKNKLKALQFLSKYEKFTIN